MKRDVMLPSLREDYLEAIHLFAEKNNHQPHLRELAAAVGKTESEVRSDISELVSCGDLIVNPTGTVTLTAEGRSVGVRVIKKHKTLQCFLSEMLGMDHSSASSEACMLEHAVSDDTINRLGEYMKNPLYQDEEKEPRTAGVRGRPMKGCDETCTPFSLLDFNEGDEIIVHCILGKLCAKRLLDLGVVPGERVRIKRKLGNQSLVLEVKGCDVALSPEIAAAVSVERCE